MDDFRALISAQFLTLREEYLSVRIGDATHCCHLGVVLVYLIERFALRHHHCGGGDTAIQPGLHDHAGAEALRIERALHRDHRKLDEIGRGALHRRIDGGPFGP